MDKLNRKINVSFNDKEKDYLNAVVTKEKTTLSEYIRSLVIEDMKKPENQYIIEFIEK